MPIECGRGLRLRYLQLYFFFLFFDYSIVRFQLVRVCESVAKIVEEKDENLENEEFECF